MFQVARHVHVNEDHGGLNSSIDPETRLTFVLSIQIRMEAIAQVRVWPLNDAVSLSGNTIGCTIWNEMATEFDMEAYEAMEKPVTIVVLAV
ncbi:hypothetical protein Tco_0240927 [Tanacetum coccineum]